MILKENQLYQLKRRDKQIKQTEIAEALGINQCTISRIEYGKRNVDASIVERYKEYIDKY